MPTPPHRCLLLLVDGLRPDLGETMLETGELPNLAAMTEEGGLNRAITVFPSTTSVAYLPFLTGCTPGRCNVPSIRWLDRRTYGGRWWREREAVRSYCGYQAPRLDADIAPDVRTIFELVPESLGIFTPIARGLTPSRDPSRLERQFWGSLAHFALWHQPSDDAVARHLLAGSGRRLAIRLCPVPGGGRLCPPDHTGSEPVRRALRRVDATVGLVRERLRRRGELERHSDPARERSRRHDGAHTPRPGELVPAAGGADALAPRALGTRASGSSNGGGQRVGDGLRETGGAARAAVDGRAAEAA